MKFIFTILFISSYIFGFSGGNLDSLEKTFKKVKHDSLLINSYVQFRQNLSAEELETEYKVDLKILELAEKNLNKSNLSKKDKIYFMDKKGRSITRIGLYRLKTNDYTDAITNFKKSLNIFKELSNRIEVAKCYSNIGVAHIYMGNYPDALQFTLKALKIREEIGDTLNMAASYNNAAYLYTVLHKYDLSLDYNEKALEIYKKLDMEQDVAGIYINMGILYRNMNQNQKALDYYLKALPVKEKGHKGKLADLYNNISVAYSSLGKHDLALEFAQKSLKLHEENGNEIGISGSLANLADSYFDLKQYAKAKKCLVRSLALAKKTNHKMTISHIYHGLTQADSALGLFSDAFRDHKLYIKYRDSLFSEENTRKATEAEMRYEFGKDSVANAKQKQLDKALIEKQNSEIDARNAEIEARKIEQAYLEKQGYYLFFGVALLIAFGIFMYNRFRITSKQKNIIESQKKEVELQKHIVDEKQKEITDSINYARRIQFTLLAGDEMLRSNLGEHFVHFAPKDIVSGDFYWATKKGNDFYLAVCDCTGHGVPGAFMSLLNISFLNEAINEKNITEPHEILNHVRARVIQNMEGGQDGMDAILVKFDFESKKTEVKYSAANNHPILISNGAVKELPCDKMPVGKGDRMESFSLYTIEFSKGDMLYLYTDGYADQFGGPKGKKLKKSNLNSMLAQIHDLKPEIQNEKLESNFKEWKRDLEQIDDVCVIGVRL